MIKKLLLASAALVSLAGCVAVPVYDSAPAYGYYYGPPAATFSYEYQRSWHDHHHHGPRRDHGRRLR